MYLSGLREKYSDESLAGNSGSSKSLPVARHSRLRVLKSWTSPRGLKPDPFSPNCEHQFVHKVYTRYFSIFEKKGKKIAILPYVIAGFSNKIFCCSYPFIFKRFVMLPRRRIVGLIQLCCRIFRNRLAFGQIKDVIVPADCPTIRKFCRLNTRSNFQNRQAFLHVIGVAIIGIFATP